ncbi:MAG: ParB N-terminal domain-containing protein [Candidatus Paceibacterota bacterium]
MATEKTTLRKEGATRTDLYYIDPRKIVVDWDENPRKDYGPDEEIEEMVNSIINEGVKVPIKVYSKEGKLHLAHGFRRMKATMIAIERGDNIERVPAQQVPYNMEAILMDHITLNSSKPLNVVEKSALYLQIMKKSGINQAELGRRLGIAKSSINVLVNFEEKASTPVKKAVLNGTLGFEGATRLIRDTEGVDAQNEALKKAIEDTGQEGTSNGGNKKKRASLTAVKKATGSNTLTPFERLVQVADGVQGTEFGDLLNSVVNMARKKRDVNKIIEFVKNGVED